MMLFGVVPRGLFRSKWFSLRYQSTGLVPRPQRLRYGQNQNDSQGWESVIGLEVHAQISARSKLFSSGSGRTLGAANSQVMIGFCDLRALTNFRLIFNGFVGNVV